MNGAKKSQIFLEIRNQGISLLYSQEGLEACEHLTSKGIAVCIGPCESVLEVRSAAKANATYIGLFNHINYEEDYFVDLESLKFIQEIKEFFKMSLNLNHKFL